jgi:hypothetical protein
MGNRATMRRDMLGKCRRADQGVTQVDARMSPARIELNPTLARGTSVSPIVINHTWKSGCLSAIMVQPLSLTS